ncbi:MAG: chorismate mutase [Acidobacteria bacterium]|nr:chorismate mutase [Acidobacteriota bacterium]
MDITDWRKKIDDVDRELVRLLNERARVVLEIARIKKQGGLAVLDPRREREVFENIVGGNQGPLENGALQRMFQHIIEESRALEQDLFEKKTTRKAVGKKP